MAECLARTLLKSQRKTAEIFCDENQRRGPDYLKLETRTPLWYLFRIAPMKHKKLCVAGDHWFLTWMPVSTNIALTDLFNLVDPKTTNFSNCFHRVLQQ
jgi:hypothetical protein